MTRYAMILNLHDCVGCGMCDIVCKIENEVPQGVFLSHHVTEMTGTFPKVKYSYRPIMCNHCDNPSCVRACPTRSPNRSGSPRGVLAGSAASTALFVGFARDTALCSVLL